MPPGLIDHDAGGHAIDPMELGANKILNARPEEYVSEFPRRRGWQFGNDNKSLPLNDNDRFAEMIGRAMRGRLVNRDLKDVNRSSFTHNIKNGKNPPKFKLPTWEVYDGKSDPTMYMMRYIRHMEVPEASEEVMT